MWIWFFFASSFLVVLYTTVVDFRLFTQVNPSVLTVLPSYILFLGLMSQAHCPHPSIDCENCFDLVVVAVVLFTCWGLRSHIGVWGFDSTTFDTFIRFLRNLLVPRVDHQVLLIPLPSAFPQWAHFSTSCKSDPWDYQSRFGPTKYINDELYLFFFLLFLLGLFILFEQSNVPNKFIKYLLR